MLFTVSGVSVDVNIQKILTSVRINEWLDEDLFHFKWWILLGLLTFFILVWWKLLDKKRLPEIMLYAVLTLILAMGIVEYGGELTLWDYPNDISPIFPVLTAINLSILPMVYSLIYQHFSTWKRFTGATIIISCLLSFGFEPVLTWAGYFQLLRWKYYYTLPVYIAVSLLIRWVTLKIFAIAEQAQNKI